MKGYGHDDEKYYHDFPSFDTIYYKQSHCCFNSTMIQYHCRHDYFCRAKYDNDGNKQDKKDSTMFESGRANQLWSSNVAHTQQERKQQKAEKMNIRTWNKNVTCWGPKFKLRIWRNLEGVEVFQSWVNWTIGAIKNEAWISALIYTRWGAEVLASCCCFNALSKFSFASYTLTYSWWWWYHLSWLVRSPRL